MNEKELYEELKDVLYNIPFQIQAQQIKISDHNKNKDETVLIAQRFVNKIKKEILSAKDEKGKNVFSNEPLRNIELMERLDANTEYQKYSEDIATISKEILDLKTGLEFFNNRFKSCKELSRLIVGMNE